MKEIVTDVGREGQVVIPPEVRELLGLDPDGRVAFVITDEGLVQLRPPLAEVIEALRGVAGSLDRPLPWEEMERIAREDRTDQVSRKLGVTREL